MVFPQVIAAFNALFDAIGLPGNLLVIITIVLETRFHVMRYVLLASLAVSDILFLILVNSFRMVSIAQETWLYGETMCHLNAFFARYFYINTVLHLIAVSYDRYVAIVKSPLTYDGTITKRKMVVIALIWAIPIALSIGPFLGGEKYVYNPKVCFCQHGWTAQSGSSGQKTALATAFLLVPFLVILILNWWVYKAAKAQANAELIQIGSFAGSAGAQQETSTRRIERRAAIDVSLIIAAFLLCYLPSWVVGYSRQLDKNIEVPAQAVLVTSCIATVTSLCNPIIYSIRKREFRKGVKNVFRRIGLYKNSNDIDNNVIGMNNLRFGANPSTDISTSTSTATIVAQHQGHGRLNGSTERPGVNFQRRCLSPIPEISDKDD